MTLAYRDSLDKQYVVSDLHLGHENIIKYANRPFQSVEEMDEALIRSWNKIISDEDEVWFLGDFSFHDNRTTEQMFRLLRGTKNIVLGNHDKKNARRKLPYWREIGFKGVYSQHVTLNHSIVLSHHPITVGVGQLNIHGHIHVPEYLTHDRRNHFCSAVEFLDYKPISIAKVIEVVRKRGFGDDYSFKGN